MTTTNVPEDARFRLDLLLADYHAAREDERSLAATQGSSISVAVSLLALLAAALTQTCNLGNSSNCVQIPELFLAAAPLGPVAVVAYLALFGAVSTIRSYYLRAIEREFQAYSHRPFTGLGSVGPGTYTGLAIELTSLRRGRVGYRLLINTIFMAVLLVFGGLTAYIAVHVGWPVRIVMAIVYAPLIALIIWEVGAATIGGQALFLRTVDRYSNRPGMPTVDNLRRGGRSLLSYLLVPRPEDWIKWTIAPGVYVVTAWTVGSWANWSLFIILWFILEFLVYAARYQWNDVRGMAEDQDHPERQARARLPIGRDSTQNQRIVTASCLAAGIRLLLALLLGWACHLFAPTVAIILAVLATAVVYEWLRSRTNTWGTSQPSRVTIAIWLVVGIGYAIRAGVAFWAAGLALNKFGVAAGLLSFAAFGTMFVLLTWTLEATSLCRKDSQNLWHSTDQLNAKAHLAELLRYVGQKPQPPDRSLVEEANCGHVDVLEGSRQRLTPWNAALLVAVISGLLLGATLSGAQKGLSWAVIAAVTGGVSGLAIAWARNTHDRLIVLAASGALSLLLGVSAHAVHPWAMPLPWLMVGMTYTGFRASSYHDLKHAAQIMIRPIRAIGLLLARVVLGTRTADWIGLPH